LLVQIKMDAAVLFDPLNLRYRSFPATTAAKTASMTSLAPLIV